MVEERESRRARFEKIAANRIARGLWKRTDVHTKWLSNLSRLYTKKNLRVQFGPVGKQQPMRKGQPNAWALFRDAVRRTGGTKGLGYTSPWELRQISKGKTRLEKGLIFVQQAERQGSVNPAQIRQWIEQKDTAIKRARGKNRAQLVIEKHRLERLL